MRKSNQSVYAMIDNYVDIIVNILAVYIAYFFSCLIKAPTIPSTDPIAVVVILAIVVICSFVYQAFNVYHPTTYMKSWLAYSRLLQANAVYFGLIAIASALMASDANKTFVLIWVVISFTMSTVFWIFKRRISITVFRILHKKQYVLRKVIIVGDNTSAAKGYVREIADDPNYGAMVIGYVGDKISDDVGCDKLGAFRDLEKILDKYKPTDVVFAIDSYNKRHLIKLVNICDDRCIRVFFLPVIYGFFKSEKQIEQIGSMPLINIHTTPLDNRANAFIKRLIDIVGSAILIVITAPIMLIAAIGTRLSSPGPVLFRQKRVGKMGKPFIMFKFRSMRVNDGSNSTWTTNADSRKTRFGNFIRRTAIDELPQLFNVLLGSMSLVGPRPELPKFVNQFKETIPLYMVKHYVKPGMTGLAQVKGLRGDTSVEERIQEDIFYIENWSLLMDISILLKTPFKAFNKNEKYLEREIKESPELFGDTVSLPIPEMIEIQEALSDDALITDDGVDMPEMFGGVRDDVEITAVPSDVGSADDNEPEQLVLDLFADGEGK